MLWNKYIILTFSVAGPYENMEFVYGVMSSVHRLLSTSYGTYYLCYILKTIPFMDRELYSLSSAFHVMISHRNSESKLGQLLLPQHNNSQNWGSKRPLVKGIRAVEQGLKLRSFISKTTFFLTAAIHGIFPAHYFCLFLCLFWGYVHLHQ